MSGGTDPFHVCPCFLPVNLVFVAAFAAVRVSFPGACPGKDGSLILTKRQIKTGRQQNSLTLILFSPRKPRFHRRCAPLKVSLWRRMSAVATGIFILTGDNALPLTTFALAFSPVNPLSVAAFAALRVSFPGACPGKDDLLF